MPEYAAYLLNRKTVGLDGKTSYERCEGKKATVLGIEFGEKLPCKVKPQVKQEKINSRWECAIFMGVRGGVANFGSQLKTLFSQSDQLGEFR